MHPESSNSGSQFPQVFVQSRSRAWLRLYDRVCNLCTPRLFIIDSAQPTAFRTMQCLTTGHAHVDTYGPRPCPCTSRCHRYRSRHEHVIAVLRAMPMWGHGHVRVVLIVIVLAIKMLSRPVFVRRLWQRQQGQGPYDTKDQGKARICIADTVLTEQGRGPQRQRQQC